MVTDAPKKLVLTDRMPDDEDDTEVEQQQAPAKHEHPHKACIDCDHSFFPVNPANSAVSSHGACRVKPPALLNIFLPPAMHGQPPHNHAVSQWPIVMQQQFCGDFRRKESTKQ